MGAIARRKFRIRLFPPSAGILGAGFLAIFVVLPSTGEARFVGRPLQVAGECHEILPVQTISPAVPCKAASQPGILSIKARAPGQHLVGDPRPLANSMDQALAAGRLCRRQPARITQLAEKNSASLPHSTLLSVIDVDVDMTVEGFRGGFGPARNTEMVEAFTVARLPDG